MSQLQTNFQLLVKRDKYVSSRSLCWHSMHACVCVCMISGNGNEGVTLRKDVVGGGNATVCAEQWISRPPTFPLALLICESREHHVPYSLPFFWHSSFQIRHCHRYAGKSTKTRAQKKCANSKKQHESSSCHGSSVWLHSRDGAKSNVQRAAYFLIFQFQSSVLSSCSLFVSHTCSYIPPLSVEGGRGWVQYLACAT